MSRFPIGKSHPHLTIGYFIAVICFYYISAYKYFTVINWYKFITLWHYFLKNYNLQEKMYKLNKKLSSNKFNFKIIINLQGLQKMIEKKYVQWFFSLLHFSFEEMDLLKTNEGIWIKTLFNFFFLFLTDNVIWNSLHHNVFVFNVLFIIYILALSGFIMDT